MNARVIGAGLSGLASAWCLADAGFDVEVCEAADEPGGAIGTLRTPQGLVERAANAFVWNDRTSQWFERLGIAPQFTLSTSRRRFIWRDGSPRRWPLTPVESGIMAAKFAAATVLGRVRPDATESVAAFIDRIAGRAATRWLIGPALQGIYAAPPDRLAARAVFGERRRRRAVIAAPAGGMGEFTGRLYDALKRRGVTFVLGQPVTAVAPGTLTTICTHAPGAAALVKPHAPGLGSAMAAVPMSEMISATAFFEPHGSDFEGFGVLFPREAGIAALGVLFNASIFAGRSRVRSETWIYGASGGNASLPRHTLEDALLADRHRLTGRTGRPIALYETSHVPGLPVYNRAVLDVMDRMSELPPWLALAGNYLGHRGVSNLLWLAERAAHRLKTRASG